MLTQTAHTTTPRAAGAVDVAPLAGLRRREWLAALLCIATPFAQAAAPTPIEVWKGPQCGCCNDWIKYLEANGFQVKVHDAGNGEARTRLGIPVELGSCHTALLEGYAIEGHVPVREMRRLLRERPQAVGLAVPGMPLGSPGMDGPSYEGRRDAYAVLLVQRDGGSSVYQAYR